MSVASKIHEWETAGELVDMQPIQAQASCLLDRLGVLRASPLTMHTMSAYNVSALEDLESQLRRVIRGSAGGWVNPLLLFALSRQWDPDFYAYLKGRWFEVDSIVAAWYADGQKKPAKKSIVPSHVFHMLAERGTTPEYYGGDGVLNTGALAYNEGVPLDLSGDTDEEAVLDTIGRLATNNGCLAYDVPTPEITLMRMLGAFEPTNCLEVTTTLFADDPMLLAEKTLSRDDTVREIAYGRMARVT